MKRVALASFTLALALLPALPATGAGSATTLARRETLAVTTSLVTPFFGAYYLEGKLRASNAVAVLVNTSYLTVDDGAWKVRAGTVGFGAGYYFQGDALRRWYVEAIAELWLTSSRHEPSGGTAPVAPGYAGLALFGYQFVFDRGPVLDLGGGVVAFHVPGAQVETAGGSASSAALTKIYPAAKVNIGWAF